MTPSSMPMSAAPTDPSCTTVAFRMRRSCMSTVDSTRAREKCQFADGHSDRTSPPSIRINDPV
jgi:hypothetical protein